MIPRDSLRDASYWERLVARYERAIQRYETKAASLPVGSHHRSRLHYSIFLERMQLLVARYSRGEPVAVMAAEYPLVVQALEAYLTEPLHEAVDFERIDSYMHALWLVSLGVLLNADSHTMETLRAHLDNQGRDEVFERLVAGGRPTATKLPSLVYPRPYEFLITALDGEPGAQGAGIAYFLGRWYRGMHHTYWYDTHKSVHEIYFGYWSFETAALVQQLAIPDAGFAGHLYYPRDLVRGS